ncbi:hypothetical protein GBAR_LOCUS19339 [Geodia barretti]|uniref:Uncharacterized protein n=1 Tax=Geodia barretti TaxID=519541 RepID=A0AA35WUJ0_GEOBA|nr:hypothetical protein GBAR_LOCUS19339 [Geodia barretti]
MSRSKSWSSDKESPSSDWSSSDEDDDDGDEAPLRPSTHSALQAQWEWRTMADSFPDNSPMGTGHTPKKKPPPIAPKPRVSWTHSSPTTDLNYQLIEDPSSFSQVQVIFFFSNFDQCSYYSIASNNIQRAIHECNSNLSSQQKNISQY